MIIPTAEPFLFPGTSGVGCLLVHGFTGSPKEMRWMGEYLAGQGHTVLGVRLAGHATRVEDMLRTRWEDWLTSAEDGLHMLRTAARHVFVMGLSMGGILSLLVASRHDVAGLVAISTPYALPPDPRLPYARLLSPLIPRVPKGPPDWHNLEAARDHVEYPFYPTAAIGELYQLLEAMRAGLPEIQTPVLLVHSRQDGAVLPENMDSIYNHLGTKDKQKMWVENCGHVITREPDRMRVFEAAHNFIERVTRQDVPETKLRQP